MPTMTIMRGLPGSGKSTTAAKLTTHDTVVCSADDYFVDKDGVYRFDKRLIGKAHLSCQKKAQKACAGGQHVIIDNTNTQRWEMEPYLRMAREGGYQVVVVDLFDGRQSDESLANRNTHRVPKETISAMRQRYELNWRDADPRKPWERN